MTIKIAVLGVGRWGTHLVRNFTRHQEFQLVAVVDPNPQKLADCRQKLNLESSVILAPAWESVRQLPGLEAVAIATPASTHYPLIEDALELGYHVLAEKPLTLEPTEGLKLCQLATQKRKQLFIDHTYLFNPAVTEGKKVIGSGKLGNLRYGYAARTHLGPVRQDVDVLWDLAIHDIGIFNLWLGQKPIEVEARGEVWLQPELKMAITPLQQQGLADVVWVTLTYPNGFRATIHLCWLNQDKQRRLCLVGESGTLIFDEMLRETPLTLQRGYFEREGVYFQPEGVVTEVISVPKVEPLGLVCDRFLESIQTQTPSPISSGWVGVELVQILTALSESLATGGKAIRITPFSNY